MPKTPEDEFKSFVDAGDQAAREKRRRMLQAIIKSWPYLSEEVKDKMYLQVRFAVLVKNSRRGSRLLRAWRWVSSWWYQLPWYRARR